MVKVFQQIKVKLRVSIKRPLLTPAELMALEEGENVVIRVIKRQDTERKRIKATLSTIQKIQN